jgi:signal transduction histidine kinase
MAWFDRLMPRSITAQITGVVAVSALIGIVLAGVTLWLVFDSPSRNDGPLPRVTRMAQITQLLEAADSPAEMDQVLAVIRRADPKVERVAISDLVPSPTTNRPPLPSWRALRLLASLPGIKLLDGLRYRQGPPSQIITRLDERTALVFDGNLEGALWPFFFTPTAVLLMIVLVSMLLLSVYAVRWITAPLAAVANAATAFGRSQLGGSELNRRGPREIIQVTDALNEMRTRIGGLLDDRTRMLAAISHDLRTPLTRLRLRSERINQDALRTAMQKDLTVVSRMLDDTLEYLRDDARSETVARIDLASFLQTICSDFADVGHTVSYAGPPRLAYACRPRALSRAITNIVDNAVKHGRNVTVGLSRTTPDQIEIEVLDDGPGIPSPLRTKVFEPFFKADDARSQDNGGFGLGLSIARDIIKRHGGGIEMRPREPSGLRVLLVLPPKHLAT